jgi:hypothetical protein
VISLSRTGGFRPPRFREVLNISDDGTFTMWRSVGMASDPATPIGKFAGRLSEAQRSQLEDASKRASVEGSRTWTISPDSPVDRLDVDGVNATLGIHDAGDGAWAALIQVVRPLLADLTRAPLAAIGLEDAALVHQGTDALRLDLSDLAVRAVHWRESNSLGTWSAQVPGSGEVEAKPGWRQPVPLDHGFALQPGDRLAVRATFAAFDGEESVPVSVQTQ